MTVVCKITSRSLAVSLWIRLVIVPVHNVAFRAGYPFLGAGFFCGICCSLAMACETVFSGCRETLTHQQSADYKKEEDEYRNR